MKNLLALIPIAMVISACSGAMKGSYDAAYGAPNAPEIEATEMAAMEMEEDQTIRLSMADDVDFEFEDEPVAQSQSQPQNDYQSSKSKVKHTKKSVSLNSGKSQQAGDQRDQDLQKKGKDIEEPMVVYTGYLRVRVKRLLEAVDRVTEITEERGGYIESLTQDFVVVRVPAGDFEGVMTSFAKIGELLDRKVKALDVSEQFTDLGARLAVAKEALARLMELLKKVEDVEERLLILQEIKRLSEQIESTESTLATLKNLVDYYTITIELQPVLEASSVQVNRSPFSWIRNLSSHRTSIYDGKDDIEISLPPEFVLFEKDDVYRAQAADTTVVRAGVVDNEPMGDNEFWINAVHHEMTGRDEQLVERKDSGQVSFELYRNEDVQPRYYLVGVYAYGEDLYVVEVFFPNEEAYETHYEAIVEALASLEVM